MTAFSSNQALATNLTKPTNIQFTTNGVKDSKPNINTYTYGSVEFDKTGIGGVNRRVLNDYNNNGNVNKAIAGDHNKISSTTDHTGIYSWSKTYKTVPEPSALFGLVGIGGLVIASRRKRMKNA